MKLLIDECLSWTTNHNVDISEAELEDELQEALYLQGIAHQYGIDLVFEAQESYTEIILREQKITLDEIDINHFLYEIRTNFLCGNFNLAYAAFGGKGCKLALIMTK